jgi:hypothetical protein
MEDIAEDPELEAHD